MYKGIDDKMVINEINFMGLMEVNLGYFFYGVWFWRRFGVFMIMLYLFERFSNIKV